MLWASGYACMALRPATCCAKPPLLHPVGALGQFWGHLSAPIFVSMFVHLACSLSGLASVLHLILVGCVQQVAVGCKLDCPTPLAD